MGIKDYLEIAEYILKKAVNYDTVLNLRLYSETIKKLKELHEEDLKRSDPTQITEILLSCLLIIYEAQMDETPLERVRKIVDEVNELKYFLIWDINELDLKRVIEKRLKLPFRLIK